MKIMMVCSAGGHLREAQIALEGIEKREVIFVCPSNTYVKESMQYKMIFIKDPKINMFSYLINFIQSIQIYFQVKPNIIISTGSGIAISIFILGWLFGARTIYIESGCRIKFPSRTGRLLYPFANDFIIQSEALKKYYPRAYLTSIL